MPPGTSNTNRRGLIEGELTDLSRSSRRCLKKRNATTITRCLSPPFLPQINIWNFLHGLWQTGVEREDAPQKLANLILKQKTNNFMLSEDLTSFQFFSSTCAIKLGS